MQIKENITVVCRRFRDLLIEIQSWIVPVVDTTGRCLIFDDASLYLTFSLKKQFCS